MRKRTLSSGLALALLAGMGMNSAFGAVVNVTSLGDGDVGSLRRVIDMAAPGDTVQFGVQGVIILTNSELLISKNLTITGPGATILQIDGNARSRVFHIATNTTVIISGLTITNGLISSGLASSASKPLDWAGGGVLNEGTLVLQACRIVNNQTGAYIQSDSTARSGGGGGIANAGILSVLDCRIVGNKCGPGGAILMSVFQQDNGLGYCGYGGGIINLGALTVSDSVISSNSAGSAYYFINNGGSGGGLYNSGNTKITRTTFQGNVAGDSRSIAEWPRASMYANAGPAGDGGGIYNLGTLAVVDVAIIGNRSGTGSGCAFWPGMFMNSPSGNGGSGGSGAGVYNGGTLGFTNTTLAYNVCGNGGPGGVGYFSTTSGGVGGYGGAILNRGFVDIVNCTIWSNSVGIQGASGYWAYNLYSASADGLGGGIYNTANVARVFNSIISGNQASTNLDSGDVSGVLVSLGHNLVGVVTTNGFAAPGDQIGSPHAPLAAQIGNLADNGGASLTCALLAGSPAIDTGSDLVLSAPWSLTMDQRGKARKSGDHVDIGAYEYVNDEAQFSLTVITNGHGTVSIAPVTATYSSNSVVTLIATPSTNAVFDKWTGSITNVSQTNTIVLTTNMVLQANFLDLLAVTANTLGGGVIQSGSSSNIYVQGTTATLVAVPSNGWQFVRWAGDASGTNAQLNLVVDKAKSVYAVFGTPINLSSVGSGTSYVVPAMDVYPFGTPVTFHAAPQVGNVFAGWNSVIPLDTNATTSWVVTNATPEIIGSFNKLSRQAVWTVTSTNDSGLGTLRQVVADASDGDTIRFDIYGKITLSSGEILLDKTLNIVGPGVSSLALTGGGTVRIFEVNSNASVTIFGLTITNGCSGSYSGLPGGGILNYGALAMSQCSIVGNAASYGGGSGGGIANYGVLSLDSCLVATNRSGAGFDKGSFAEQPGDPAGHGGGIYSEGVLLATNTTVVWNTTGKGGDAASFYSGCAGGSGGWGGGVCSVGVVRFVNCTIDQNTTGIGGAPGYSKYLTGFGPPGVPGFAGGLYVSTNGAELINTLIAGNSVPSGAFAPNLMGSPTSLGHNLISSLDGDSAMTPADGDLLGTTNQPIDAKLGALADNGGPTMTVALLSGSPAIDAGDDAVLSEPWDLMVDQRGQTRKTDTHVDIGAYEYNSDTNQFRLTMHTQGRGFVTITPALPTYASNTVVTLVETPAINSAFSRWTGAFTNASETNTIVITSNMVVQANFVDMFLANCTTPGGGWIEVSSTNNRFAEGTSGTLQAVASNGWQFICWTGDAAGTNAQIAITMESDKSVKALFGTPVSVSSVGDGTAYAVPSWSLYPYGSTVSCYSAPAQGSAFSDWEANVPLAMGVPAKMVVTNAEPSVVAHFTTLQPGTSLTVTTTNDNGPGSLRQAVLDAKNNDTIVFAISGVIVLTNQEILIDKDLAIVGPGAGNLAINGNAATRIFEISSNASALISGLTLTNGFSGWVSIPGYANPGGAVVNWGTLRMKQCSVCGNTAAHGWNPGYGSYNGQPAGHGGGVANFGVLELDSCLVATNQSGFGGDAIRDYNGIGAAGGNGGGVYSAGVLKAKNTTIYGNATGVGGKAASDYAYAIGGDGGLGGGIYSVGLLSLANCTLSSNSAGAGGAGGLDYNGDPARLYGKSGVAGGLYASTNGTELLNTLVAGNIVPTGAGAPNAMGTITSLGHNLLASLDTNATVSLSSSDLLGTSNQPIDAMLGLLSDNGGPTMTVALQSGSPAIDAGDDLVLADPWNLTTDQRGLARKQGNHVDIGAYESPYTHVELTRLAAGFSAANEQFTVVLSGTIGKSYDLLSSTDLVHWSRVTTLTNTTGKVTWILPLADSAAAQYFRAQQLP